MVEHSVHTRSVICSSQIAATRPVGQKVKTPPFHGGNMGSIPVRVTKRTAERLSFLRPVPQPNPVRRQRFGPRMRTRRAAAACGTQENLQTHDGGFAAGVFPYGSPKRNHPVGWFLFGDPYFELNPSGSITSGLPSSDGRDAAHRSFWQSQKKLRRDTEPAPPAEYSRTYHSAP